MAKCFVCGTDKELIYINEEYYYLCPACHLEKTEAEEEE
jgi:hypothetical protein